MAQPATEAVIETKPQAKKRIAEWIRRNGPAGDVKFDRYLGDFAWEIRVGNNWYTMRVNRNGSVTSRKFTKGVEPRLSISRHKRP